MAMKYLQGIVFILIIASCRLTPSTRQLNTSWRQCSIDRIVDRIGYPDNQITASDGNKVYVYHFESIKTNLESRPEAKKERVHVYNPETGEYSYGYVHRKQSNESAFITTKEKLQCSCFIKINKQNEIMDISFRGDEYCKQEQKRRLMRKK